MSERTAVYRFFDADDALLYVGVTQDFLARRQQHASTKGWWPEVRRHVVDWFDSPADALEVELEAIKGERPRYNVAITNQHYRGARPVARGLKFMGTAEIRDMLGAVSRQRVQQLISRPDWPKAAFELKMGKVWDRADIEQWMRDHGREVAEDGRP